MLKKWEILFEHLQSVAVCPLQAVKYNWITMEEKLVVG